jgi:DNA-binding beta-propeller fold protein YncE
LDSGDLGRLTSTKMEGSVIDGDNNQLAGSIKVGNYTEGITTNQFNGKLYLTSVLSDEFFVVDSLTNKIEKIIKLSNETTNFSGGDRIALNPYSGLVYVSKPFSDWNVSVTNTNSEDEFTHIGSANKVIANISNFGQPFGIAVNQNTNMAYIISMDTLYVVDGYSNNIVASIPLGDDLKGVAVNPITNTIYITKFESTPENRPKSFSISAIDGYTNEVVSVIPLGKLLPFPEPNQYGLAVNPTTNMVYVSSPSSDTISVMNGSSNKLLMGVNFNVKPADSGEIYCNNKLVSKNYSKFEYGSKILCEARSNIKSPFSILPIIGDWINAAIIGGFTFDQWSGDIVYTPNEHSPTINATVSSYGESLTANFKETAPLIPGEYINTIFGTVLGIILPAVGALIFTKRRRAKRKLARNEQGGNIDANDTNKLTDA